MTRVGRSYMTQLRAKQSRALNGSTRHIKLSGKLVRTRPLIQNLRRLSVFFNDFDIVIIFLKTQNNVWYYWLLDPVKLYFSGPPPIDTQSRSTSVGRIKLFIKIKQCSPPQYPPSQIRGFLIHTCLGMLHRILNFEIPQPW